MVGISGTCVKLNDLTTTCYNFLNTYSNIPKKPYKFESVTVEKPRMDHLPFNFKVPGDRLNYEDRIVVLIANPNFHLCRFTTEFYHCTNLNKNAALRCLLYDPHHPAAIKPTVLRDGWICRIALNTTPCKRMSGRIVTSNLYTNLLTTTTMGCNMLLYAEYTPVNIGFGTQI